MFLSNDYLVHQLLVPAVALFFLVWSLVGAAIGAGLILSSASMFRLFRTMNRYVSTRRGLKALAMEHDVGHVVRRHRRLIGGLIVLGAAYCVFSVLAWFDHSAIALVLDLRYPRPMVIWIVESARWSLIVFSVFAIVIGIMLVYFPDALGRVEALANRWISIRKYTYGAETMNLALDRLVEAYPRAAGAAILVSTLYVAANAALLWLRFR